MCIRHTNTCFLHSPNFLTYYKSIQLSTIMYGNSSIHNIIRTLVPVLCTFDYRTNIVSMLECMVDRYTHCTYHCTPVLTVQLLLMSTHCSKPVHRNHAIEKKNCTGSLSHKISSHGRECDCSSSTRLSLMQFSVAVHFPPKLHSPPCNYLYVY